MTEAEQLAYQQVCSHFYRHVVCLAVQYVALDDKGMPVGKEQFLAHSAFVMSFRGLWFLVTAGHALESLDRRIQESRLKVTSCCIADYFGPGAKVHLPTPFHYDQDTVEGAVYDDALGFDFGLIYLREFLQRGLEANGVLAISENDWVNLDELDFDLYYLLGFPKETVDEGTKPVDVGQAITATVPMVVVPVHKIEDMSEIPSTVELRKPVIPPFIGKVPPGPPRIEGMSGGPIIGVRATPNGGLRYWVVAIQSGCYEGSRIIMGCPLQDFGVAMYRLMQTNGLLGSLAPTAVADGMENGE
jgi:hypothetical protein